MSHQPLCPLNAEREREFFQKRYFICSHQEREAYTPQLKPAPPFSTRNFSTPWGLSAKRRDQA
jgi:hypothetical protein